MNYKSLRNSFGFQDRVCRSPVCAQVAHVHEPCHTRIRRGLREQPAPLDIHALQVGLAAGSFRAGQVKDDINAAHRSPQSTFVLQTAHDRFDRHPQR